jgi:hypothetical protein
MRLALVRPRCLHKPTHRVRSQSVVLSQHVAALLLFAPLRVNSERTARGTYEPVCSQKPYGAHAQGTARAVRRHAPGDVCRVRASSRRVGRPYQAASRRVHACDGDGIHDGRSARAWCAWLAQSSSSSSKGVGMKRKRQLRFGGMPARDDRKLSRPIRCAPGTITIALPRGRDIRGRFTRKRVIALEDWISDRIYPSDGTPPPRWRVCSHSYRVVSPSR